MKIYCDSAILHNGGKSVRIKMKRVIESVKKFFVVSGSKVLKHVKHFFLSLKPDEKNYIKINGLTLFFGAATLIVISVFLSFFLSKQIYYGEFIIKDSNKISFDKDKIDSYKVDKFQETLNYIKDNFYLDFNENDLLEGALAGMVKALNDPYSRYLPPTQMTEYTKDVDGEYNGVGVVLSQDVLGFKITQVYANSPAEEAGIKVGDIITAINDVPYKDITDEKIAEMIQQEGKTAKLSLLKQGTQVAVVELVVKKVLVPSVFVKDLEGGIKYIKITQFDFDTGTEFDKAIKENITADCKGLIIDLRNNPGGFEKEATKVADIILPEGIIATAKNKAGDIIKTITSNKDEITVPIVILVNGNSASASEFVAGAVRDFKKGTLIGTKTFGKALAQNSKLYDKDGSGIVITTARYFTPSGECIHGIGITPNIVLELPDEYKTVSIDAIPADKDNQLQKALEVLKVGG